MGSLRADPRFDALLARLGLCANGIHGQHGIGFVTLADYVDIGHWVKEGGMAIVKTGIGATKRDLLKKIGKLKKFVDTRKGEFSTKDKVVFKKALISMSVASSCSQDPMRSN